MHGENAMNIRHCTLAPVLALWALGVSAASVPPESAAAMEKAGVPMYPGAVYCTGDPTIGIRFATSDAPEKVQAWYRERLAGWTLFNEFGMWALVDAPSVGGLGDLMANNQLVVSHNAELPGWHGLAADMTTDITTMLPKVPTDVPGGALVTIPPGEMPPHSEAVQEVTPFEVTGALGSGEDMEFGLGSYFYIQDEEYREYPVVYADGMSPDLFNRLYSIGTSYDRVRVKGRLIVLQDGRPLGFDRSAPIEIYEVD